MNHLLRILFLAAFAAATEAADWPQWRGPARDGTVAGGKWPETLDEQALTQTWRGELQPSYSGPVISGDRVFVTEMVAKKIERVRALDGATGKELCLRGASFESKEPMHFSLRQGCRVGRISLPTRLQ